MQHASTEAPSGSDYRFSHTKPGKAKQYDARFSNNTHRRIIWRLEQEVLEDIVNSYAPPAFRHLDFACGTGRILKALEGRAATSTGVDVSPEMLGMARLRLPVATLHHVDLTQEDVLDGQSFDLITAFRFFPNAQPALRVDSMRAIVRRLADNGIVIFNNHLNNESLRYRMSRIFRRRLPAGMSRAEVADLVHGVGLHVIRVYHMGVFPVGERFHLIPPALLERSERLAMKRDSLMPHSQNLIYVCRRERVPTNVRAPIS